MVRVFAFDAEHYDERPSMRVEELRSLLDPARLTWVDVAGLGDARPIEGLGKILGLHPLALEDVVNVHQRPKVEPYDDYVYIVLRTVAPSGHSETEQVSMFLGRHFVLTFQERPGDCFEAIRERIRKHRGRVRTSGADYLAYAIIDAIVDQYFPLLDAFEERLAQLEEAILEAAPADTPARIHDLRNELFALRRAVWPLRDVAAALLGEDSDLITQETRLFLRDCHDHALQLRDIVETCREITTGLMDTYHSSVTRRTNEVMKVLTVIATIFIPLTFMAGIYGMNFDPGASPLNMPELRWYWGYPFALGLMAMVAAALLVYFRRKGWFGGGIKSGRAGADGPRG